MILTYAKAAFVKVPRTGGTTLATALLRAHGMERDDLRLDVVNLNWLRGRPGYHGWHVPLSEMQEWLGRRYAEFTFFGVVREPAARLVSVYRWQRQKQPGNPVHADFGTFMTACWSQDPRLRKQALRHTLPQRRWLEDRDGTVPPGVALLATEQLDERLDLVRRLVGLRFPDPPERRNVTHGPGVEVAPSVRGEIERRYAGDFELHEAALR